MLRCTKDKHANCTPMRNAAMNSSKKVLQAYTTGVRVGGARYCVTGKALVKEDEVREFTENLWNIRSRAVKPTGVKDLKVLVSQ